MEPNKLAQIAYRAYGHWVAWTTPQGQSMPDWNGLPVSLQNAWTAATGAVASELAKTPALEPSTA